MLISVHRKRVAKSFPRALTNLSHNSKFSTSIQRHFTKSAIIFNNVTPEDEVIDPFKSAPKKPYEVKEYKPLFPPRIELNNDEHVDTENSEGDAPPIPIKSTVEARSFSDIINDMRARQNRVLEIINTNDTSLDYIRTHWTSSANVFAAKQFKDQTSKNRKNIIPHDYTDQQMYMSHLSEGDLVETTSGDVGVILQVPDYKTQYQYAIMDHQGAVTYIPNQNSFVFRVPQFIQSSSPKTSDGKKDPRDVLASYIRVLDPDPRSPVVTVTHHLKEFLCPEIKKFIEQSLTWSSYQKSRHSSLNVITQLGNMFNELQETSDPINISLFEVAYAVQQNIERALGQSNQSVNFALESFIEDDTLVEHDSGFLANMMNSRNSGKEKDTGEKEKTPAANDKYKPSQDKKSQFSILKAKFPPPKLQSIGSQKQRIVSKSLLYSIYTSIKTSFNTKVLFDSYNSYCPNFLTLLPFSLENGEKKALEAMRLMLSSSPHQEPRYSISKIPAATSDGGFNRLTQQLVRKEQVAMRANERARANERNVSQIPPFIKTLINAEKDPSLLEDYDLKQPSSSTQQKKRLSEQAKTEREILNLIQRYAVGDMESSETFSKSVVVLFLKRLFFYRNLLNKNSAKGKDDGDITPAKALKFLINIGIVSPNVSPVRYQSKLKTVEQGGSNLEKLIASNNHFLVESQNAEMTAGAASSPTGASSSSDYLLPDRVEELRRELDPDMSIYCIDDATAHEIDDGISISNTDQQIWNVFVHIADPSSALILDPKSVSSNTGSIPFEYLANLFKHAYQQTSTAYYPDTVIPMFPKWLTNHLGLVDDSALANLSNTDGIITQPKPPARRRCFTVEMKYDSLTKKIDLDSCEIYPSLLPKKSTINQITYNKVDEIFTSKTTPSDVSPKTVSDLNKLLEVAVNLSKNRFKPTVDKESNIGGAISVSLPKPSITIDENLSLGGNDETRLDSITISQNTMSLARDLVAEFMVLCNSAVAEFMSSNKIPGIFRGQQLLINHQLPETNLPASLTTLPSLMPVKFSNPQPHLSKVQAKLFDSYQWDTESVKSSQDTSSGLGPRMSTTDSLLLLPVMKAATLGVTVERHMALGIPKYTHSTSPLRRFQDVITHWQIHSHLLNQKSGSKSASSFDIFQLDTIAIKLMQTQRLLKQASFQSNNYWLLYKLYMLLHNPNLARGRSDVDENFALSDCIVTSPAFYGQQRVYLTKYGVSAYLDLNSSNNDSASPSKLANIGETLSCKIQDIDLSSLSVVVKAI